MTSWFRNKKFEEESNYFDRLSAVPTYRSSFWYLLIPRKLRKHFESVDRMQKNLKSKVKLMGQWDHENAGRYIIIDKTFTKLSLSTAYDKFRGINHRGERVWWMTLFYSVIFMVSLYVVINIYLCYICASFVATNQHIIDNVTFLIKFLYH